MANSPGQTSYRRNHGASRQTMVLRRAKEEDERRLAEAEGLTPGAVCSPDEAPEGSKFRSAGRSTRLIERGTAVRRRKPAEEGGQVVVDEAGGISRRFTSTRLTGKKAASVRLAGGDTIIRYEDGGMVVRRGARRASLQKQAIVFYAAGYILLFGLYAYFLFTGTTTMTPAEFVDRSFARRASSEILDLEQAAYSVMRGSRTPAEIRVAQNIGFYDENEDAVHVEAGNRLTLLTAAKLAQAIIRDAGKPEALRTFTQPIRVYRETHLSGVNWPVYLSLYNAFGFFLLLALFLWRPLMHYLGTQGKKTAVALRNSRDALTEAEEYQKKYRGLSAETAAKAERLRLTTQARLGQERAEALENAARQADAISGGIRAALESEEREVAVRIGSDAARQACDLALEILKGRIGRKEHDRAVDELVADIGGMDFTKEQASA